MPINELTRVAAEVWGDGAIQVEVTLPTRPRRRESGNDGRPNAVSDAGCRPRIPRITRLMALAIKFQDMVDRGEVRDYAGLARLGYVSRARLTQIMNLLLLAPDIQERVLFGIRLTGSSERALRVMCAAAYWPDQRSRFGDDRDPST